jgi:uncharacterized protein YbaR (Trm112 family)
MFLELVDSLRCLADHEETWLVASVASMAGRHIVRGTLGCPVCGAEYPIVDGIARFDRPDADATELTAERPRPPEPAPEDVMRAAALLGLTEGGGVVLLDGRWSDVASPLLEIVQVHLLLVDPPRPMPLAERISVLRTTGPIPLAAGTLRAAALDASAARPETVASAVKALRARGRLVMPASAPVPAEVLELARDDADWVGERTPPGTPPVRLTRAR